MATLARKAIRLCLTDPIQSGHTPVMALMIRPHPETSLFLLVLKFQAKSPLKVAEVVLLGLICMLRTVARSHDLITTRYCYVLYKTSDAANHMILRSVLFSSNDRHSTLNAEEEYDARKVV